MSDVRNKLLVWLLAAGVAGQAADAEADQILDAYRDEVERDAFRKLVSRYNRDLDEIRREVAHELAEKIRAEPAPERLEARFVAYANGWEDGRSEAADLIDPEVADG